MYSIFIRSIYHFTLFTISSVISDILQFLTSLSDSYYVISLGITNRLLVKSPNDRLLKYFTIYTIYHRVSIILFLIFSTKSTICSNFTMQYIIYFMIAMIYLFHDRNFIIADIAMIVVEIVLNLGFSMKSKTLSQLNKK